MEEKNKLHISLSTIVIIIAIFIIAIMAIFIVKFANDASSAKEELSKLEKEKSLLSEQVSSLQSQIEQIRSLVLINTNLNSSNNNSSTSVTPTSELDKVKEVANKFITAFNSKDWETVKKYWTYGDDFVNTVTKYNITNLKLNSDFEYIEEPKEYFAYVTYDHDEFEEMIGGIFVVTVKDDKFSITPFATGI